MVEVNMVTRYYVKCRMSAADEYFIAGWAGDEENLKELLESLRKTWRYCDPVSYRARECSPQPVKRTPRK